MNLVGLVNSFRIYSNFFGFKKWYVFKDVLGFVQYVAIIKSKQNLFVWSLNLPKNSSSGHIWQHYLCSLRYLSYCWFFTWVTWVTWATCDTVGFYLSYLRYLNYFGYQNFTWVTWGIWTTFDTSILLKLLEVPELLVILEFYLGYLEYLNYTWDKLCSVHVFVSFMQRLDILGVLEQG